MNRQVFINANLFDGINASRTGATVVLDGEKILSVSSADGEPSRIQSGDAVYDLNGRTLMPGMVSGHFHCTYHNLGAESGIPTVEHPPIFTGYRALANAQLALRNGFTGVVGAGNSYLIDPQLSAAIDQGLVEGPRVIPCSPDTSSSADGFMPWWTNYQVDTGVDVCDGPEELRRAVRRSYQRGARLFKLTATGGHGAIVPKGRRLFAFDELRATVEAAHELGMRVRAHISGKPFILECIRAGIDILDHCDDMDEECIDAMVKADVFVLPSMYHPFRQLSYGSKFGFDQDETRQEFEWMCGILSKAQQAGVKLCVGDDFGTVVAPHGDYANELAVYVDHAGIDPLEVMRWATRNGAGLMGMADELGTIEAGKRADLVIVDGDPTRDIKVLARTENIVAVMRDGRFYSKAALEPDREGTHVLRAVV
jgi:imidazolonepropionase-like amidohydrolase